MKTMWTLGPVRSLILRHAAQLEHVFQTKQQAMECLQHLQWASYEEVPLKTQLLSPSWVSVLHAIPETSLDMISVLQVIMQGISKQLDIMIRRKSLTVAVLEETIAVVFPHLLWLPTQWCKAHQQFCAFLHRCMDYFSNVSFGAMFQTLIDRFVAEFERRNMSIPESPLFTEVIRSVIETVAPETITLQQAQCMTESNLPFQMSEKNVTIPVNQLLSGRTLQITCCGLCFEVFQTAVPDHHDHHFIVLRWICPGNAEQQQRSHLNNMTMRCCTDRRVSTASADVLALQPFERKFAQDENILPCCIKAEITLSGFVYCDRQSRSREVEPLEFDPVQLVLIPYDQVRWAVPRSPRQIESLQLSIQVAVQLPQLMMSIIEHADAIVTRPEMYGWVAKIPPHVMYVLFDTRLLFSNTQFQHPPEKTMDLMLFWLDQCHEQRLYSVDMLNQIRDQFFHLFPIDRVDLFWLFDTIRSRSRQIPFRRFNQDFLTYDAEDGQLQRLRQQDHDGPQNWLSTSPVVNMWVRRCILHAAERLPKIPDTLSIEYNAYSVVPSDEREGGNGTVLEPAHHLLEVLVDDRKMQGPGYLKQPVVRPQRRLREHIVTSTFPNSPYKPQAVVNYATIPSSPRSDVPNLVSGRASPIVESVQKKTPSKITPEEFVQLVTGISEPPTSEEVSDAESISSTSSSISAKTQRTIQQYSTRPLKLAKKK